MSVGAVNKQTGDRIPTAGMPAIDNALSLSSTNPVQNAIITAALAGKQNTLTFDDVPTDNSDNPVKSNGIYDALALKQNITDNNLTTTDKTTTGAINELKSGLNNVMKVPSQTKTTIGYADIDGTNPVEISVSNLTNYDFIVCGISYYATGLANYGIVTIPVSELSPMLDDVGTPIIILAMGGGLGYLRVKFNTNKDKIIFTPDAVTNLPGRYYFIHGINIRG